MNLTDPMGLFVSLAIVIVLLSMWLLAGLDSRSRQRRVRARAHVRRHDRLDPR